MYVFKGKFKFKYIFFGEWSAREKKLKHFCHLDIIVGPPSSDHVFKNFIPSNTLARPDPTSNFSCSCCAKNTIVFCVPPSSPYKPEKSGMFKDQFWWQALLSFTQTRGVKTLDFAGTKEEVYERNDWPRERFQVFLSKDSWINTRIISKMILLPLLDTDRRGKMDFVRIFFLM